MGDAKKLGMLEALFNRENYIVAQKMLDASELRHRAITSNLANVETPGYKRVDLDTKFQAKLERAMDSHKIDQIQKISPMLSMDPTATSMRPDGNNVKVENEMLAMNRNTLEYQFLTDYVSSSLKKLKTAMSGK